MPRFVFATTVGALAFAAWAISGLGVPAPSEAAANGWDFPSADQVMLVEPNGRWHLHNPSGPDRTFWYGVPGDVPLLGDWDGDGVDTPGMYRPATGLAYLSNTFPPDGGIGLGDPALTFYFGARGDRVFSGDWDGDGVDTLGIFRRGKVYLAGANATGVADREFWFGTPTDVASGGNGDGDEDDSVFLYRPSIGFTYHTHTTPSGPDAIAPTDGSFFFGQPDDRFVVGDWDGDATDTAGVFRPADTTVYLRNSHTTGPADESYVFGGRDWIPVAGRVGDFMREVIVSPVGTEAENGLALREAAAFVRSQAPTADTPWVIRVEPGVYNVWENDGETFNIVGLDLPDHTSLIGAGPDQVTIRFEGLWSTGIRLGVGALEGFTFDFWDHQGAGIILDSGTVRNVAVVGIVDRGGTGVSVGSGSVIDTSIEVREHGSASAWGLRAGEVDLIDSVVEVWGAYGVESVAVSAWADLSVRNSTVRAHGYGSNYRCVGISSSGADLEVIGSTVESCLGAESLRDLRSAGIRADAGRIEDSRVVATPHPIDASGQMSVADSTLAGGAVRGDVSCENVDDGYGTRFNGQCPGLPYLFRVNGGGSPLPASDTGPGWSEDSVENPSPFGALEAGHPDNTTATWPAPTVDPSVPALTPLEILQTERWTAGNELHYSFPVGARQAIEVRLYFASGYDGAATAGDRVFDVTIDDRLVLDDYDIVADVGHRVGVMKSFIITTDFDGIDIVLSHVDPPSQHPLINAIEILIPERLIVVEGTATPAANGRALLAAMSDVVARNPGPGQEWIVKLEPGTFELGDEILVLEPYVAIEGSGLGTTITRSGSSPGVPFPDDGVVHGADHAALRHLSVTRPSTAERLYSTGIIANNASPHLVNVRVDIRAYGPRALQLTGFDGELVDVDAWCTGVTSIVTCVQTVDSTVNISGLHIYGSVQTPGEVTLMSNRDSTVTMNDASLHLDAPGGSGIANTGSTLIMKDGSLVVGGGHRGTTGISNVGSDVDLENVRISGEQVGGSGPLTGILSSSSTVAMRDVAVHIASGDAPTAFVTTDSTVTMDRVTLSAREDTFNTGWGIINQSSGPDITVTGSSIFAPTATIDTTGVGTIFVAESLLAGGPVTGSGLVVCENVTDEHGAVYPDSCPD